MRTLVLSTLTRKLIFFFTKCLGQFFVKYLIELCGSHVEGCPLCAT